MIAAKDLNWPITLKEISFNGLTATEVWFLKESIEADPSIAILTERNPKFGYLECDLDLQGERYMLKYRDVDLGNPWKDPIGAKVQTNKIFYVRKHKT